MSYITRNDIEHVLYPLSYRETVNYCRTNKRNLNICEDDGFWVRKAKYNYNFDLNKFLNNKNIGNSRKYQYIENGSTIINDSLASEDLYYASWFLKYNYDAHIPEDILQKHSINTIIHSINHPPDLIQVLSSKFSLRDDYLLKYGSLNWYKKGKKLLPIDLTKFHNIYELYDYVFDHELWKELLLVFQSFPVNTQSLELLINYVYEQHAYNQPGFYAFILKIREIIPDAFSYFAQYGQLETVEKIVDSGQITQEEIIYTYDNVYTYNDERVLEYLQSLELS
jgi:hypothetical protein